MKNDLIKLIEEWYFIGKSDLNSEDRNINLLNEVINDMKNELNSIKIEDLKRCN